MRYSLYIAAMSIFMLSSCSSLRHTSAVAEVDTRVVSMTVADVNVSPVRVSKTTTWNYNPFQKISVETITTNTTAWLLNETGADVLVEPQTIVEKRGFLRGGSVTVTGFPAKYTNFHTMTSEEAEILSKIPSGKPVVKKHKRFILF